MKKSAAELHDIVLENLFALTGQKMDQWTRDQKYLAAQKALSDLFDLAETASPNE